MGSFPDPYGASSLGHLLALLVPRPRSVLLVGGVERGLVPVLLRHPVERLVVLEPDAAAFAFLLGRLPEADRAALRDPRVRVVHEDPRRFVAQGRVRRAVRPRAPPRRGAGHAPARAARHGRVPGEARRAPSARGRDRDRGAHRPGRDHRRDGRARGIAPPLAPGGGERGARHAGARRAPRRRLEPDGGHARPGRARGALARAARGVRFLRPGRAAGAARPRSRGVARAGAPRCGGAGGGEPRRPAGVVPPRSRAPATDDRRDVGASRRRREPRPAAAARGAGLPPVARDRGPVADRRRAVGTPGGGGRLPRCGGGRGCGDGLVARRALLLPDPGGGPLRPARRARSDLHARPRDRRDARAARGPRRGRARPDDTARGAEGPSPVARRGRPLRRGPSLDARGRRPGVGGRRLRGAPRRTAHCCSPRAS